MPGRRDPGVGKTIEVGPALVPGARRRNTNHVEPVCEASPRHGRESARRNHSLQLIGASRTLRQVLTEGAGSRLHIEAPELLSGDPSPPHLPGLLDGGEPEPVIAGGDHVYRAAQQSPLNHPPLLERRCQRFAPEIAHSRPQPDVSRGRVLRLQSCDALQRGDKWRA